MGAALVTSSSTGSAGVSGLEAAWHKGQDEGHRPLLWHSMRTPAAMRLVPDSDRLVMYSGNVSTLGSLSRSSDSSEGELPARQKRKRINEEGGQGRGWGGLVAPEHGSPGEGRKGHRGGKNIILSSYKLGEPFLPGTPRCSQWENRLFPF